MGFLSQNKNLFVILMFVYFFVACVKVAEMRLLRDQQLVNMQDDGLLFQSLKKGQDKSSGSNPCGNIPGQATGVCSNKIAGNVERSRTPAFSKLVVTKTMPLEDQQWLIDMKDGSLFHSLQKGQGKSSRENPCDHVPGQSKGICSKKIAGNNKQYQAS